jgi:hypothetical protein
MNQENPHDCIDRFSVISKILKYFVLGLTVACVAYILNQKTPIEDLLLLAFATTVIYSVLELGN